ncbi:hypothetical protein DFH11DRAFT_1765434 [Phellopilus nigrolimitatus]|nr:hypothetical protein DFH11DRAFT_1765434 [Phellopilus nigrolimitatus]
MARRLQHAFAGIAAGSLIGSAQADQNPAQAVTCNATTTWMNNAAGSSPCTVAYYLMLQCNVDMDFTILPLNASSRSYANPLGGEPCTCNNVVYNLMSACAVCQGGAASSYATWTAGCTPLDTAYPNTALAANLGTPKWAYVNVSSAGGFDLAAVEDAARAASRPRWSPIQIALPIITTAAVALLAGALFFLYRRRLKRRYALLSPAHAHSHQHSASTSTSGSGSTLSPGALKHAQAPAWVPARLQPPRRLGGLLADRRTVHPRPRAADWSIDADAAPGPSPPSLSPAGHAKSSSSSGSGGGSRPHSKSGSGSGSALAGALRQGHASSASLASKLSAGRDSLLGLLGADPRRSPVAVVSAPPRRGFNLDGADSARSPTLGPPGPVGEGVGVGENEGEGEEEPESSPDEESVLLISRAPGQDFNSAASPVETDGVGTFHVSPQSEYWPAALTDASSVLPSPLAPSQRPPRPSSPPPSFTSHEAHPKPAPMPNPHPPPQTQRLLIPSHPSASSPLAPPAPSPSRAFARLFGLGGAEAEEDPADAASPATRSSHSSEAYTVPNPFTFATRGRGGVYRALLAAPPLPHPPPSGARREREVRPPDFDLDA